MSIPRLADIFFEHDGKLTDKWEQYLPIYQGELDRFIAAKKPIRLLEIGVQNGGSLEVWQKFLPAGSAIFGVDIDPAVDGLQFTGNVRAFVADINDIDRVKGLVGPQPFDVIIDDGSHTSSDIISTFKRLFPDLAAGGKYIVEDLHCSYWDSHGGGLRLRTSAIEYFKGITDALNADHFHSDESIPDDEISDIRMLAKHLARITFYDSVVVVEKLAAEKTRPYRHMLSGQRADVNDPAEFIAAVPSELIRPWIVGEKAARSIDMKLKEDLETCRQEREQIRADLNRRVEDFKRRESDICAALHDAEARFNETRSELDIILRSRSWRATSVFRNFAKFLRGFSRTPNAEGRRD